MEYFDEQIIKKLGRSKFRSSFHLKRRDIDYIDRNGMDKIREHAYDFLEMRLKPAYIENDGSQTPMKNHPVFIAQHATATCCRNCMQKWHGIKKGRVLSEEEMEYCVNIIMQWIESEYRESSRD